MKTSKKIIVGISILILLAAIILNIVLLCTNVYKGTYESIDDKYRYTFTFYDNTFTANTYQNGQLVRQNYGFFQCVKATEYQEAEYDTLILNYSKSNNSTPCRRNSVFSFTTYPNTSYGQTYTCQSAILLQILYALLIICCIIAIILVTKKNKATEKDGE